ncbi:MAG: hypothetical protein QXN36_05710 [Candidatus Bathyarchaeia archaeon]
MHVPKVEERRIICSWKNGYAQYSLTLPKKFVESLKAKKVTSLYVIYDGVLIAFPANIVSKDELIALLNIQNELEKLLAKEV